MSSTVNRAGRPPNAPLTNLKRIFRDARRDPELAVLEGLHVLKHALRFGAHVEQVAVADPERVRRLAQALAPDVAERMMSEAEVVTPEVFAVLVPQPPSTGVVAVARRRQIDLPTLLADGRPAPIVLLEQPTDLGNLGACVRVAAAADAAGVLATGVHDPWDPAALRGSAGLHFALPVARLGEDASAGLGGLGAAGRGDRARQHVNRPCPDRGAGLLTAGAIASADGTSGGGEAVRPLVAIDPAGEVLHAAQLPPRAILAFGGERRGLSEELLCRADARVRLPMREGVSSLNLATAVAATLYGLASSRACRSSG